MEIDNIKDVQLSTNLKPVIPITVEIKTSPQKILCDVCQIVIHRDEWKMHTAGKKHSNKWYKVRMDQKMQREGILVSGFPPSVTPSSVANYFQKFGRIIAINMKENKDEALVQFINEFPVQSVLERPHYFDGCLLNVRPRNCSSTASKENVGNTTIPTPKLLDKILAPLGNQKIEEQINLFVSSIEITKEEENERQRISRSLERFLSISFPGCKLHPFGSLVAGLAFRGSDLDLHITKFKKFSKMDKTKMLEFLRRTSQILRTHPEVEDLFLVTGARVPVINLNFSGTTCDITSHNRFGIQNSKLLRFLQTLDTRVKPYLYIIKYWIKKSEMSMSSYATTLMAVFYLQQLSLPILPPIEALQQDIPEKERQLCDNWNIGFNPSFSFGESLNNPSSILELVRGFFAFYAELQPGNVVLCPLTGVVMNREQFALGDQLPPCMKPYAISVAAGMKELKMDEFTIQDPFELNFNPVSNVQNYPKIQQTFMKAQDTCRAIIDFKCENGLASLFFQNKTVIAKSPGQICASICLKFQPTTKVSKESLESFLDQLKVFFDRLFCSSYFITAVQAPSESPRRKQRRVSLSQSSPKENEKQSQTSLNWNQSFLLTVPFDLWTGRKEMAQVLNSEESVLDAERAASSRIEIVNREVTSESFASLSFSMIYRVKTSTVVLNFDKAADTTPERLRQFVKGLRYHLKSVMDRYLLENQLPFSNICCS